MPKIKAKPGYLTIPQVAKELNCEVAWVRTLIRDGKIEGNVKRPLTATQWRWEIPVEWVAEHKQRAKRSRRDDGRTRYNVWLSPAEVTVFEAWHQETGQAFPYEVAYKPKPVELVEGVEYEDEEDED